MLSIYNFFIMKKSGFKQGGIRLLTDRQRDRQAGRQTGKQILLFDLIAL